MAACLSGLKCVGSREYLKKYQKYRHWQYTMFERYTETARRMICFARYEGSQCGSSQIETEHLLLGLLRQDKELAHRFLHSHAAVDVIRKQIEGRRVAREQNSTSVDLPLSRECKRVRRKEHMHWQETLARTGFHVDGR